MLHQIVERLLKTRPHAETPFDDLRARLLEVTAQVLADQVPWPAARAFWQSRIEGIADQVATDELARLALGQPVVIEKAGSVRIAGMDFRLTAKPDRIDRLQDGSAHVYDYKSGKPPSQKEMEAFDKQLPLEAAMVMQGGFDALGPVDVSAISYIRLGGEGKTETRQLPDAGETWDRFVQMITGYLTGATGFTALRAPRASDHDGDYAHLARLGEWDLTTPARAKKVGGDG